MTEDSHNKDKISVGNDIFRYLGQTKGKCIVKLY